MEREEFEKLRAKGNQVIENIDGCKMVIEDIEYLLAEKEDISNTMMFVNSRLVRILKERKNDYEKSI